MPGLARAVRAQGAAALAPARRWASADHPGVAWLGVRTLAALGEPGDVPRLVAELHRMREAGHWCAYDILIDGLVRFGSLAVGAVPVIRDLWTETPHSYERASYLAALAVLDPGPTAPLLEQALFDCEYAVRLFAIRSVRVARRSTALRLAYLRDDPLEDGELPGAAAARCDEVT